MAFEKKTTALDDCLITYWEGGDGPPLLLAHGTGPGAGSLGYWKEIMPALSDHFHVIAYDLIGFGKSGRKPSQPYFDCMLWLRQATHMARKFGGQPVNIIGHSVSGSTALRLAAAEPQLVNKVLVTGTVGAGLPMSEFLKLGWTFPKDKNELRQATASLFHDQNRIDDAYLDERIKILQQGDYGAYFTAMFGPDKQALLDQTTLSPQELSSIHCDVLLVHGRSDKPAPLDNSLQLASRLRNADLLVLNNCGHSVALEHPNKLIGIADIFFSV